jgi:hypothetical protein
MAVGVACSVTLPPSQFPSSQGFLLPGEEKTLQFTVFVSNTIAAPLNLRIQELSTLLIVHTLFGQDRFLSVSGEYGAVRSSFKLDQKLICLIRQNPHASEPLYPLWLVCLALYAS